MRLIFILLAMAGGLFAQQQDHYLATASTTALTLQAPASNARQITFGSNLVAGATVSCAADQTATVSWNGSVATATAGSEKMYPGTRNASGLTVWTASNSSGGTTAPALPVTAGSILRLELSWFQIGTQGTGWNVTITTTGACIITYYYSAV